MSHLPEIVAIGAGNIASHIIPALYQKGCTISQVFSRTHINASGLAHKVKASAIDDLKEIKNDADIYILMISDDSIPIVLSKLPTLNENAIVCHTSGATDIDILANVTDHFGSFYPLQSFKKNKPLDIKKVPFLINASNRDTLRTLRVIARQISTYVENVSDEERLIYHLSAVFVNNFSNHMACIAQTILEQNNLNSEILKPIIETTFQNIITQKACDIQTGPAIRQDYNLQRKHLKIIKNKEMWNKIYKTVSDSIHQTYNTNENS